MSNDLPETNASFPLNVIKLLKPSERLLVTWLYIKSCSMYKYVAKGKFFDPEKVREPLNLFRGVWEELSGNHPEYKELRSILDCASKFNDDLVNYDDLMEVEEMALQRQRGQRVPLLKRIASDFLNAITPLCEQLDKMNDAAYILGCEVSKLEVNDPIAALFKHGQLPDGFKKVIQVSALLDTPHVAFSKELGNWMKQQMLSWAECWEKSFESTEPKSNRDIFKKWPRLSQEVLSKAYSLLIAGRDMQSDLQEVHGCELGGEKEGCEVNKEGDPHTITEAKYQWTEPMAKKDFVEFIQKSHPDFTVAKLENIIDRCGNMVYKKGSRKLHKFNLAHSEFSFLNQDPIGYTDVR